jgi:hypothetical protein
MSYQEPKDRREQLRIKLKSLALEALVIREEERRARFTRRGKKRDDPWKYAALQQHRVLVVRHQARLTHLAYGAIRGLALERMETPGSVPLTNDDKKELYRMVWRYGPPKFVCPEWLMPEEVKAKMECVAA